MLSLFRRDRKKVSVYLLAAAISLPLGYFVVSWSMNTYSFLALYRPEQLFQENDDPAATHETKGTEILQALNAEIEQESHVKQDRGRLAAGPCGPPVAFGPQIRFSFPRKELPCRRGASHPPCE